MTFRKSVPYDPCDCVPDVHHCVHGDVRRCVPDGDHDVGRDVHGCVPDDVPTNSSLGLAWHRR